MAQFRVVSEPEHKVLAVTPLADKKLLLEFENGEKRIYDITPLMKYEPFSSLMDESLFYRVHVTIDHAVGWNDNIDLCPDCVYDHSIPV